MPPGKVERSILCHIGSSEIGLLSNCLLLFRGSKSNKQADHHTEMNWAVFSDWCEKKVFPSIAATKKTSVVVLDRATYQTVLDEEDRRPVTSWNKSRLIDAIRRRSCRQLAINLGTYKTKHQLLDYARNIYPSPKYKIQKIADKFALEDFSIKIIFLSVAHPELDPIEMVWGFVKRNVAAKNMLFKLSNVEEITKLQLEKVTADLFNKFYKHTMKEEEKHRKASSD